MSLPPRRNSDEDHFGRVVPESLAGTKRPNISTDDSVSLNRIGRYWPLYFPRHEIDTASKECMDDIKKFASYLQTHPESFSMDTDVSCLFDYPTLLEASPVKDFSQRIFNEPQHLLCCLGLAVCCVLSSEYGPDAEHILGDHRLHIHLLHHEPLTHMKSLKSSLVGKLVTVRGTVVRTSPIKPLLVQAQFNCARCSASQTVKIVEGNYEVPVKCITQGCKSRVFEVERGVETGTRTVDWQQIRIQEKINDDPRDPGRVPRSIDAELLNDLVDTVVPGDVVNCTGIVKVMQSDEGKGKGRPNSLYILYLDTVAIDKVGGSSNSSNGAGGDNLNDSAPVPTEEEMTTKDGIHFSNKDLQFIRKVYKEPKLFRLLVHSFSPAIFGHEMVKAGIMLALFGARKRLGSERGSIDIRSDLHVLVVGDPGLGKSQMLTAVGQIAPRGVYVCGTSGISTSGLTVTLVKEAGSGDFALEAGALVLSDMGCCAIDEFDKGTQASQYVQSGVNDDGGFSADGEGNRLRNWLRLQPGEKIDAIPPSLMRKYVAYARKYVQPRLSTGATRMLREFYLELRKTHRRIDSMPITTRQLEALVRLAEARARAELREIVTESDAENVIEIMRYSLFQTYEDEEGLMDFGRSQMGTGVSGTSDIKRFVARLHRVSEETYNNMFTYSMMQTIATEMGLRFSNFQDVIDRLNNQSYLIKKGPRSYQLTTV
ncbi:hypothetical protein H4S08_001315 [Coemansia sp. RSA 1365]|nr:hypothetical protein H4S08_001315 [Coemansia sp. RSA 1365]